MVRKRHKKRGEYQCGEILVCRQWMRFQEHYTFNVNYEYMITPIDKGNINLRYDEDIHLNIPIQMVKDNFIYNYCKTCHSFQGSSVDGHMIIFDWKFKHVDRKWIYTACTRATNMAKALFYRYEEEQEQEELLDKFLEAKVEGYKQQDRKANRDVDTDSYITAEL